MHFLLCKIFFADVPIVQLCVSLSVVVKMVWFEWEQPLEKRLCGTLKRRTLKRSTCGRWTPRCARLLIIGWMIIELVIWVTSLINLCFSIYFGTGIYFVFPVISYDTKNLGVLEWMPLLFIRWNSFSLSCLLFDWILFCDRPFFWRIQSNQVF